uniref:Broad-complex n=1 Tax=Timema genevievae TaxID=629358 RepID=A0A7R9K1T4_TIMGE|nr:unnamed protein product [Timema genevievae]
MATLQFSYEGARIVGKKFIKRPETKCSVVRGTMADAQHFCLRWNNYQSSITSAFENLRDDEDFVDVTLACDGRSLKAHRVVLSACSPYFRELLKSTPCKHPVIVLQDVSFADLHALVEFIYHGEVNVHQRNLSSFLKTAEVLRVSGLTQQAEDKEEDLSSQGQSGRGNGQNAGYTAAKLEDSLFPSPPSPPLTTASGAIVNQRRPTMSSSASRRERRNSAAEHSDSSESPSKKVRPASQMVETINNNHSPEPVARPSSPQLSPQPLSVARSRGGEGKTRTGGPPGGQQQRLIGSNGSWRRRSQPPVLVSSYLTAAESKLFASSAGSFNFSMAALAADASNLSGLGGQGLNTNSDGTPGTSQAPSLVAELPGRGWGTPYCPLCRKSFTRAWSLQRHMADTHFYVPQSFECDVCGRSYRSRNSLVSHRSQYHARESLPPTYALKCKLVCVQVDNSQDLFKKQKCYGSPENLFMRNGARAGRGWWGGEGSGRPSKGSLQCPHCDKRLLNRDTLSRHVLHMHQEPLYAARCTVCNREYRTRNSLMVHMSRYHRRGPPPAHS